MSSKNELLLVIMAGMDAEGGNAAADAVAIWESIARKFSPLLGPSSASMLLERSLHANHARYPWLPPSNQAGAAEPPFRALQTSMAGREQHEVVAATRAMLESYIDLVSKLIGSRLTEQFLRAAFEGNADHRNTEENAG